MNNLEQFALHWTQQQLAEILAPAVDSGETAAETFHANLPLLDLPGRPRMRSLYAALRRRGVRLPPLFLSWAQFGWIGFITLAFLGLVTYELYARDDLPFFPGVLFAGAVLWIALVVMARSWIAQLSSVNTVGELAGQILFQNVGYFRRISGVPLTAQHIERIVIRLLGEVSGWDVDEIQLDTPLFKICE